MSLRRLAEPTVAVPIASRQSVAATASSADPAEAHVEKRGPCHSPIALGAGKIDFTVTYASQFLAGLDNGASLTVLAGVMVGCFELFAHENVRTIGELKGKSVGVQGLEGLPYTLVALLTASVGLNPKTDVNWVTDPKLKPIEVFAARKIDAFLGFPPEPQDLRARKIALNPRRLDRSAAAILPHCYNMHEWRVVRLETKRYRKTAVAEISGVVPRQGQRGSRLVWRGDVKSKAGETGGALTVEPLNVRKIGLPIDPEHRRVIPRVKSVYS